ncbi:armadillo-type protein [Pholiota molesta]|nr:armadillo-type protein [Pholiota molesta]
MDQEIDRIVQAIAIASDHTQISLHQQALAYISSIQQNANETWRLALKLFVDQNADGTRKYPVETRFWGLRLLDDFLDNRFERFDDESFATLQQALISYIQSEYVLGPAEADTPSKLTKTFNRHVSLLFFHIVLEISGEVADQIIKSARSFSGARHARDAKVRDGVRDRDAARINEAVLTIVSEGAKRMEALRENPNAATEAKELDHAIEVVDWGIRTFGSYVGWIDINLTVTPTTVPLLFTLLADPSLPIRLATSVALLRIVSKGLKEPSDKLQLLKVLSLGQVLDALEAKTRAQQIERGNATDEGEESYREALGKLLNVLGQELAKLIDECSNEEIRAEASNYLLQIQPAMLHFLADEYDDTSSRRIKRAFLSSLLEVILVKMKWDEEPDPDEADEDDIAEFDKMRKDLRVFLDSILSIDQDLVTKAVRTLAVNTITAYRSGATVKWNDAELGIYLMFIFGEINKTGGKGRAAFCQAPPVDKDRRKAVDYSEYPLTTHGEMLFALVQSGIASYPNRMVALQFFETVSRYTDFFKVRKDCIIPTLEAMVDPRGLHNANSQYRSRMFYLFHRFIKELRNEIPVDISTTIIDSMRDLLPITAEIPEPEEPETDVLTEAIANSSFDSQLYLFETVGILCSLIYKTPAQQSNVLLSLVKPLMDDLSLNFQAFQTNGPSDLVPIVKVHHIIMALGNISKGFPDYPPIVHEDYILPPLEVFAQMAQAILVCLEAMNILKPIRDATRFAFARILATAGPTVTHYIPPLMSNLLAHFEPSELVDFMNFIGLLIHKLSKDMFDVLDQLIGPLSTHITSLLSQPITGTDDQRAHVETKKAYLALLNSIMASKLQGIFISERNSASFENLMQNMQQLVEDVSDPASEKAAVTFLSRCVTVWGQTTTGAPAQNGAATESLPGFERFIYERLIPTAFRVPSMPNFNLKDGQITVVLQEIANLLQTICKTRGAESYTFFLNVFLPSQNWPPEMALDFTTKLRDLEGKNFRKYFTDLIRSSRASS